MKQMKPKKKKKTGCSNDKTFGGDSLCGESFRDSSQNHKKYNVPCAMKPSVPLKNVLVHPKDREDKEQTTECVYKLSLIHI